METEELPDEDEYSEHPKRGRRFPVAFLIFALIVLAGVGFFHYENQQRAAIAAKIGDVSITPEMSLADYRRALGMETSADTGNDTGLQVANASDFQFGNGMVIATFLGKDPGAVPPHQIPIYIAIDRSFKGRVCGVHTSDTLQHALSILQNQYPGAIKRDDFETRHEIDLDGTWSITFDPYGQGSEQKVGNIVLRDMGWADTPSDTGA